MVRLAVGGHKFSYMSSGQWECVEAMLKGFCLAALVLMAMPGRAESTESANQSVEPARDAPGQALTAAASDSPLWRTLVISQGAIHHEYHEPDPFGRVNPLNSETGPVPTTELTLRWSGKLARALPDLVMQASVSYAQGQTDYSGYLQQGVTLTPYSSRTGNTVQALRLRVGLPLTEFTNQPWAQHVAPYAEQSWHRWQRNLTQYGETFDWQTCTLGVMGLWPLAELGLPQLARLTLEADVALGRTRRPSMSAPTLSFVADLGEAHSQSAALALHFAVTPTWKLGLRYTTQRSNFGASASLGGLQYPGAYDISQGWLVSVGAEL